MATAGFFGKLPSRGDFVDHGLPYELTDAWDEWLGEAMVDAETQLAGRWTNAYRNAPPWCLALGSGEWGDGALFGVFLASRDRVGREYPLLLGVAWEEPVDVVTLGKASPDIQKVLILLGRLAVAGQLDPGELAARLDSLIIPEVEQSDTVLAVQHWNPHYEDAATLEQALDQTAVWVSGSGRQVGSLWWREDGGSCRLRAFAGLPDSTAFVRLLQGR